MKEVILIKQGELALKGLNKKNFEDALVKDIRRRLSVFMKPVISCSQSIITVEAADDGADMGKAAEVVSKVFGIAGYCRAAACEKNMADIVDTACEYLGERLGQAASFKAEARRSDKSFPLKSPEICREVGEKILERFPNLRVDVHSPELVLNIEVRDTYAYVHAEQLRGAGGMPCGSSGKGAVLISGGIDSPVAAWYMAKRGLSLCAIHFASPPYTSARAEEKVHRLLKKISCYCGRIELLTVPFTEIQEHIKDDCPEELFTILMRRMMMKIASALAVAEGCGALITGESLGQVASQTLPAIACTDEAAGLPVLRPLIGMDKDEIIATARKTDTFDISIEPYQDCCTVFTPKHPRLKPKLEKTVEAEKKLEEEELIKRAIENTKRTVIDVFSRAEG